MKSLCLLLALVPCLISTGCVKRIPLTPVQTNTLNLNQSLAAIATTNKAMATDVISLNRSGVLAKNLTHSVLAYNQFVAQAVLSAESIQRGNLSDADKAAAIRTALEVLQLPPDVAALIGSPQGNQAIAGIVATITLLQQLIGAITGGR